MTGMIYPAIIMGGLGLIFGALLAFASKNSTLRQTPARPIYARYSLERTAADAAIPAVTDLPRHW